MNPNVQVLILGGGPGGYSCALRSAELGLDVLLVEPGRPGGTCLHAGCIPSKALIQVGKHYSKTLKSVATPAMGVSCENVTLDWDAAQVWKNEIVDTLAGGVEALLEKAGVQRVRGRAQMLDGRRARVILSDESALENSKSDSKEDELVVQAQHVVLALGACEIALPSLPASNSVLYAEAALSLNELPDHLAVVGGGYIGLELGQAYARMGVSVTVVEAQDQLLPAYPKSLVAPVVKSLTEDGVQTMLSARAESWAEGFLKVTDQTGEEQLVRADKVLVAIGRKANLEGWGRDQLALDLADGFVAVDSRCETSMSGVFAVGDLTGEPMLAHRAIAQGQVVAECLAGRRREFSPVAIPAVCFTSPEIVCVGLTAQDARDEGRTVLVKRFPLAANGRSLTLGSTAGFIEVVACESDNVLLGVQAVGENVAELAHSFTLALEMGARLDDIADTVHAHPTIGESFAELCQAALGLS